jgi:hypothetical protein
MRRLCSRKDDDRIEMSEQGLDRLVSQIVGGNVDGLHRGDRADVRRDDALLDLGDLREERRLVTDGRRHAPEQSGEFAARLHEAEHVVDEEEHLAMERVTEVFGVGQRRLCDAEAYAGRLVHLSEEHQRRLHHARVAHGVPEFVPSIRMSGAYGRGKVP